MTTDEILEKTIEILRLSGIFTSQKISEIKQILESESNLIEYRLTILLRELNGIDT